MNSTLIEKPGLNFFVFALRVIRKMIANN